MLSLMLIIFTFQAPVSDTLWTEEGEGYSIQVRYPQIALQNTELGILLEEQANGVIAGFMRQFQEFIIDEPFIPEWDLELSFVHEPSPDGLACIVAWHWEYTGGAHGNSMVQSIVFDLNTSTQIGTLELLGGEEEFQALSREVIEKLKETEVDETWVERGASAELNNYLTVFPVPSETGGISGYTVLFPPYQVACYACGTIEVFIPAD